MYLKLTETTRFLQILDTGMVCLVSDGHGGKVTRERVYVCMYLLRMDTEQCTIRLKGIYKCLRWKRMEMVHLQRMDMDKCVFTIDRHKRGYAQIQ